MLHRGLVLIDGQAAEEASIGIDPAFVSGRAEDDGHVIEPSVLVQRARWRASVCIRGHARRVLRADAVARPEEGCGGRVRSAAGPALWPERRTRDVRHLDS